MRHETLAPAELELCLLLVQTRAAREANADLVGQLAGQADLARLARGLARRRVLPLLGTRLRAIVGDDRLTDEFLENVEASRRRARATAMTVQMHTQLVVADLAGRGIRALELKGPGLAERAHGDLGLRSSTDIDLLVHRSDLFAAVELLKTKGYGEPKDPVDRDGLPRLHFNLPHPQRPPVEVHWRVHWYEDAFSADLLDRATPGPDGSLVAQRADEAAAILLFFARDGFSGMRILCDLTGWWERQADAVGKGLLDNHIAAYPELARTWQAAALVAEQVGGLPAGGLLSDVARADRRMRLAMRLTSWSQRDDRDQLAANVALVDGLLTPRSAFGGFVRSMFEPEHPFAHVVKFSLRWIYALWRIRRRPWDHDILDGVHREMRL